MTQTRKEKIALLEKARSIKAEQVATRDLELATAIEKIGQPLTLNELAALDTKVTGRRVTGGTVIKIADRLVAAGLLATRPETADERILRGGGRAVRGRTGMYYVSTSKPKARRTAMIAVDGYRLGQPAKARKKSATSKKNPGLPKAQKMQTGTDISEIISRRIDELQARIDELQKMQTGIKNR
jgi:hypothetical protein